MRLILVRLRIGFKEFDVYLTWGAYVKTVSITLAALVYISIIGVIVVATGNKYAWFGLIFGIAIVLIGATDIPRSLPDHLHMIKKMSYRVIDGYIYVKLPLAWVMTQYDSYDGSLERFQEKKLEYTHSGKGRTFRV